MEKVKIKEITKQIRGVSYGGNDSVDFPKEGYLPIMRSNNINDGILNFDKLVYVPNRFVKNTQLLKKGDILITASTGSMKVIGKNAPILEDFNGSFGAFCKVVRPQKTVNSNYLKHFFQSNYYKRTIQSVVNGANINNIKNEHIDDLEIPLPPLATQQHIAAILDQADAIIQNNRAIVQKYDALTQSLFLDMFGDPVKNEKGWEKKKLGDFGNWKSGGTPSRRIEKYFQGTIPWISSGELNEIYIDKAKEHISEEAVKNTSTHLIEKGSLLLGMYDTAALKSSINTVDLTCNQAIAFAKLNNNVNTLYVYYVIQYGKEHYKSQQRGVRQKNLNLSMIKDLKINYPPIELQNKFAERVAMIEAQKKQAQLELAKSEELFQSLLQRAFKGELN